MYFAADNPYGADAFAAPASDNLRPKQRSKKRQLPPAPTLTGLVKKIILL